MTLTLMPQPPGHCWQTEATQLSGPGGHGASASSLSISFSRTHPDRASPAKAAVENFKKSRRSSSISRVHYLAESGLHGSPMTAIAVGVDLFLPMARDAPVHVDRLRRPPWGDIARFDLPMTRLALELPQDDVAPVGEEGVVGNPVESDPTDLFLLLGILGELLLFLHVFGFLGLRPLVTVEAIRKSRQPGGSMFLVMRVTGAALGLLDVGLVTKPHGLPRRRAPGGGGKEDGGNDQEKNDSDGQRRLAHETFSPLYMEGPVISLLPLETCDPGSLDRPDQFPRVK